MTISYRAISCPGSLCIIVPALSGIEVNTSGTLIVNSELTKTEIIKLWNFSLTMETSYYSPAHQGDLCLSDPSRDLLAVEIG